MDGLLRSLDRNPIRRPVSPTELEITNTAAIAAPTQAALPLWPRRRRRVFSGVRPGRRLHGELLRRIRDADSDIVRGEGTEMAAGRCDHWCSDGCAVGWCAGERVHVVLAFWTYDRVYVVGEVVWWCVCEVV